MSAIVACESQQPLNPGALVFAKVKGYPPWPARVEEARPGDKYRVMFFGTYEIGTLDRRCLFDYAANRDRFARPSKRRFFMEALDEIELRPTMRPLVTHELGRHERRASGTSVSTDSRRLPAARATAPLSLAAGDRGSLPASRSNTVKVSTEGAVSQTTFSTGGGNHSVKRVNARAEGPKSENLSVEKGRKQLKQEPQKSNLTETSPKQTDLTKSNRQEEARTDAVASDQSPPSLLHSRSGRAIKPKRLNLESTELDTKSPRKSAAFSSSVKIEQLQACLLPASTPNSATHSSSATDLLTTSERQTNEHSFGGSATSVLQKNRRKFLISPGEQRCSNSPTNKKARLLEFFPSDSVSGTNVNHRSNASGPSQVGIAGDTEVQAKANFAVGARKGCPFAEALDELTAGNNTDDQRTTAGNRNGPAVLDDGSGRSQRSSNTLGGTGVDQPAQQLTSADQSSRGSPYDESGLATTGEDLRSFTKDCLQQRQVKHKPSTDEIQKQVAFLQLITKKICSKTTPPERDVPGALEAIAQLEESFVMEEALRQSPETMNTLRQIYKDWQRSCRESSDNVTNSSYTLRKKLGEKAFYTYHKIKSFMLTLYANS